MATMYDSVTASDIPTTAEMVAGYVDGRYAWSEADWGRFPNARKVRIAVSASTNDGDVLDVENGDATPAQAVGWAKMRRAAGISQPTCYVNRSNQGAVEEAFAAANEAPPTFWVATLDGTQLPLVNGVVACQYSGSNTSGGHYDLSTTVDGWPVGGGAPAPAPAPAPAAPGGEVTVKSGDTMSGIAQAHGVSLQALEQANPHITNPNLIYPGEVVLLPGSGANGTTKVYHVVSGDNLSTIAARFGESLATIEAKNPQITNPDLIYPGEAVNI